MKDFDVDPFGLDQFDEGCYIATPDGVLPEIDFDMRAAAAYMRAHNISVMTDEVKAMFLKQADV